MTTLYLAAMDAMYEASPVSQVATNSTPSHCIKSLEASVQSVILLDGFDSARLGKAFGPLFEMHRVQVSPTTLFLIEGCGQLGSAMNWGDGYITDALAIRIAALSDPNPFFTTLVSRPYLNNVVIAPHYYPPSVSTSPP